MTVSEFIEWYFVIAGFAFLSNGAYVIGSGEMKSWFDGSAAFIACLGVSLFWPSQLYTAIVNR